MYFKKCTVKFALFFTFIKMYFIFFTINLNYFAFFVKTGRVPKTVIFTGSMLNISCLKGNSDQTKFRFGISVKNCIGCDRFGKNPRNFIFHRKIYRKSENSERIRLIFELDRDIDVTMLCEKFEGCEAIISGVIV